MRSYSCFYRSIAKKNCREWSASLGDGGGDGDVAGRGGLAPLMDPRAFDNIIKFIIKPPEIRTHHSGGEAWNPWWRTAVLV